MITADNFLAHYGVKGMKWGVRKREGLKESFIHSSENFYKSKTSSQLKVEAERKTKTKSATVHPTKRHDDGDPTGDDLRRGKLSKNQKIVLGVGVAAAAAGLAYYGHSKLAKKEPYQPIESDDKKRLRENGEKRDAELDALFGVDGVRSPQKDLANAKLGDLINEQFGGLVNKKAFERPEFTIPKDTIFQRLSNGDETGEGYNLGTYASFLTGDNGNYGSSIEFGSMVYNVNFNSKGDVRVPSLTSVLKTVKEVGGNGNPLSDDDAFALYHKMSGGSWRDDTSSKVIKSLKSQGYSAIVDDMDAGYLGDLPIVFFGEPTNLKTRRRTRDDYDRSEREISYPSGRYA